MAIVEFERGDRHPQLRHGEERPRLRVVEDGPFEAVVEVGEQLGPQLQLGEVGLDRRPVAGLARVEVGLARRARHVSRARHDDHPTRVEAERDPQPDEERPRLVQLARPSRLGDVAAHDEQVGRGNARVGQLRDLGLDPVLQIARGDRLVGVDEPAPEPRARDVQQRETFVARAWRAGSREGRSGCGGSARAAAPLGRGPGGCATGQRDVRSRAPTTSASRASSAAVAARASATPAGRPWAARPSSRRAAPSSTRTVTSRAASVAQGHLALRGAAAGAEVGPREDCDDHGGAAHPALDEVLDREPGGRSHARSSVRNPAISSCHAIHVAHRSSAGQ